MLCTIEPELPPRGCPLAGILVCVRPLRSAASASASGSHPSDDGSGRGIAAGGDVDEVGGRSGAGKGAGWGSDASFEAFVTLVSF